MGNREETTHDVLALGAQVAEVEALFSSALTAPTESAERQLFAQLAWAATRLGRLAENAAGDFAIAVPEHRPLTSPGRARIRRRIASTEHTADRIIAKFQGEPPA
ncbi:hypothetical protein ACGFNU_35490 [Spirillospora sp. NPDC048911]|uniref:hypothetical protein n=1 Tax=Spirillospora sp. NPDC048911 TaxID=3364527 RepID=UPI003722D3AA